MLTITFTEEQARGLAELIDLAERGREGFEYQASFGDYTEDDMQAAEVSWQRAQVTAEMLRSEPLTPINPVSTVRVSITNPRRNP